MRGVGAWKFQQWDGTQWTVLTDWIATDPSVGTTPGGGVGGEVCAGQGDQAADLPVGARRSCRHGALYLDKYVAKYARNEPTEALAMPEPLVIEAGGQGHHP